MSQYKAFLLTTILCLTTTSSVAGTPLQRALKPSEIETLRANIKQDPANINSRLFLANHYYAEGKWREVAHFLSPIVESLAPASLYMLGVSYLNSGSLREAESIVTILLSQKKEKAKHLLLAVEVYDRMHISDIAPDKAAGYRDKVFTALKEAKESEPNNAVIYNAWLDKLDRILPGSHQESLRVLEDMKRHQVAFEPRHYSLLCKHNYLAKFPKETSEACKQAIIKDPNNPANSVYLSQILVETGNEEAGKRMLASMSEKISQSEEALWTTANIYYENKDLSSAFTFYKKATGLKEAQPRDFLGLARVSFELKKYDVALDSFVEHCRRTNFLDQEFRKASGQLIDHPKWQDLYRNRMQDCNAKDPN